MDTDYLDVGESERADGCQTDPVGFDTTPFDYSRKANGADKKREKEDTTTEKPELQQKSEIRTYPSKYRADGEKIPEEDQWDAGGNLWRAHVGKPMKDKESAEGEEVAYHYWHVGSDFDTGKQSRKDRVELIVDHILNGDYRTEDVVYDVLHSPNKHSWNSKGLGFDGMAVGYSAYVLSDDPKDATANVLERIDDSLLQGTDLSRGDVFKAARKAFDEIADRQTRL
ncbi:hypothetical protein [Halapricum desulfuricans]|nr:hypothetical protein [Halapricum desulfuricans]